MPLPGVSFSDEQLFRSVNFALPGWILITMFPRAKWAHGVATLLALLMSALYAGLMFNVIMSKGGGIDFAEMSTYKGVAKLLATREVVLPAWVHYVAFDLWTGLWMARDSVTRGIPQLLLVPCLLLTLMLGPTGLLLYCILRGVWPDFKRKAKTT